MLIFRKILRTYLMDGPLQAFKTTFDLTLDFNRISL